MNEELEKIRVFLQADKSRAFLHTAIYDYLMAAHQPKLEELIDWTAHFMAQAIANGSYDGHLPEHALWSYGMSYDAMSQLRHLNMRHWKEENHVDEDS